MPCWLKCHLPSDIWSSRVLGATMQGGNYREAIHLLLHNPAPSHHCPSSLSWQYRSITTVSPPQHSLYTTVRNLERRFVFPHGQTGSAPSEPTQEQLMGQGQPEPQWQQDGASCKLRGQGRSCSKLDKIAFLDCISQYPLWKNWLITAASVL